VQWSGSRGYNLYDISNINLPGSGAVFLGDPSPTARLNAQYSNINWRSSRGDSFYNALIVDYRAPLIKRYGLQFTSAYTYAKAMDDLSTTFSEAFNNFNLGYLDPYNPRLDWGPADNDIRHRYVLGLIWQEPYRNGEGWLNTVLNGWTVTGIFAAHTGTPFTIWDCTNALVDCVRLVQTAPIKTNVSEHAPQDAATPDLFHLINTSNQTPGVFINPITGTSDLPPFPPNMTGRNRFRGPGFWNLDAGIYKDFRFREAMSIQLRLEAYNVFNHANMFVIGSQADVSSFSFVPGQKLGSRNVQLAVKFIF